MPVIPPTTSFRLSMCWTLSVVYVDPGVLQLVDIRRADAGEPGITCVREFVDQDQRGVARQRRIDIEFRQRLAVIGDVRARQDLEPLQQCRGFPSPVRFEQTDDDILSVQS